MFKERAAIGRDDVGTEGDAVLDDQRALVDDELKLTLKTASKLTSKSTIEQKT